jgi:hypothetical protein
MKLAQKLSIATAGFALLTLGTEATAQAVLLGQRDFSLSLGSGMPFSNEFQVQMSILERIPGAPGFFPRPSDPVLFEGTIVTPSDVGRTFSATQATDPDFNNFVAFLTNGQPNQVNVDFRGAGGIGTSESFLKGDSNSIDFLGNTINSISLRINSLTVVNTTLDNPERFALNTFSTNFTVSVDGQPSDIAKPVPEPLSILGSLTAVGVGAVLKRKHLKKQRISVSS